MRIYEPPPSPELTPLYLSAADGGIEHSIEASPGIFWNSFVYNLLFTEGGIVIPDVFFFNCKYLIEHLASNQPWPLLLDALRGGLAIPAFRSDRTVTFEHALTQIGAQNVLGVELDQYQKWQTTPYKIARRLDEAVSVGDRPTRIVWPPDMGGLFDRFMRQIMERNDLPSPISEEQESLWAAIEPWRELTVQRAVCLTEDKGGTGLRRAEMFNALGEQLGILGAGRSFPKPRDLVKAVLAERDPLLARQVSFYVDVVNAAYQKNQADAFQVINNALSPISPTAMSLFSTGELGHSRVTPSVMMELRLPSASRLLAVPSDRLLGIRESGSGKNFFAKRRTWMRNQSPPLNDILAEEMREAARQYADALSALAGGPDYYARMVAFSTVAGTAIIEEVKAVVDLMKDTQGVSPYYALVIGSVSASMTAMLLYRPKTRKTPITVARKTPPEVNFPRP